VASAFTRLGAVLGLDWAQATAARLSPSDPWERLLVGGLARDFQQMRLDALRRWNGGDPVAAVDELADGANRRRCPLLRNDRARAQGGADDARAAGPDCRAGAGFVGA
jgi:glutamate dehydrogenase